MTFAFDNTYARLAPQFHARVTPTKVRAPRVIKVNRVMAEQLGVSAEWLESPEGAEVLAGNVVPEGAEPIALAYAGHQFGHFVPQLGDGRAILLGEVVGRDGKRRDVQLKGSGRTPFSRGGDGRAALGPVLREYVVSEAMAAFGIPTTRALAAVTTGEPVLREQVLPGAVFTRVAASHLRVGTFEYFAARDDREALGTLVRYALERHYPSARTTAKNSGRDTGGDALALLESVIAAQAALVARWLGVGFVHGVMNTDNTSISGETIDYGPCAFLDEYDPKKKFSSIDHGGRYAFGNQPRIAQWNLARLAETLLPMIDDDPDQAIRVATERLERFGPVFEGEYTRVLRGKLGLTRAEDGDLELASELLAILARGQVDHTIFFRALCGAAEDANHDAAVAALFPGEIALAWTEWAKAWRARQARDDQSPSARASAMRRTNPAFIPRNHRIEEAITAATDGDFGPFETLVRVLARPFDDQPDAAHLAEPPKPEERVTRTFCGT
jgi:uncharacterized protein YdiU (UPF0061 family)